MSSALRQRFAMLVLLIAPLHAQSNVPRINEGGVVNAGDYTSVLSPGMHMSVFGVHLAGATKVAETATGAAPR